MNRLLMSVRQCSACAVISIRMTQVKVITVHTKICKGPWYASTLPITKVTHPIATRAVRGPLMMLSIY